MLLLYGGSAITLFFFFSVFNYNNYSNIITEKRGRIMVYLASARYHSVVGMNNRRTKFLTSIIPNSIISTLYDVASLCRCGEHDFSSASESDWTDFPVENAYELLGVSETSSFTEIKASFRKLAKETHPDLAESSHDSSASRRFVQILAAYEVCATHAQAYEL